MESELKRVLVGGPLKNQEIRKRLGVEGKNDVVLDRTLQRLKRGGQLILLDNRWALASFVVCEACGGKGWVPKGKLPKSAQPPKPERRAAPSKRIEK